MKKLFSHLIKAIRQYAIAHKIISSFIALALATAGYWSWNALHSTAGETRYVIAAAEQGTIITTVTGSGQVSSSNQVDLKPKASGDIIYIGVANGQEVKVGTLIAQLDARDAQKAVRDAEANLTSAQLSLEKLKQPADDLSIIQAENSLARAQESKQNADDDLKTAYEDGYNKVADAFLDLPTVMAGLQEILYSSNTALVGGSGQWNADYYASRAAQYTDKADAFKDDTYAKYQLARSAYDQAFNAYKSASRFSDTATIESLIDQTYTTSKNIAEAVKSGNNLIQLYKDELTKRSLTPVALADTHLASLNTYTGTINSHLSSLLSAQNAIKNDKDAILNATRSIDETTASLAKLKAGADVLDIQSSQLSVTQRTNALLDAREKLSDYYIRAPFDGTVAKLDVKKGDAVTSGTAIATFITKQQLAEISLNEVDVSKVKVGQKVTLTFDAIEGLTITGSVAEIDSIGTVSQGVVSYAVKISFDTQDNRIKPGMSTSAAIITDIKQNILVVPNSAIKTAGTANYVEMPSETVQAGQSVNQGVVLTLPPRQQAVEIGISNDTLTEIVSGLKSGDQIITRTIQASAQTAQTAPSLFQAGGNRAGAGATRILR